jgi:hypothetical protein
MELMVANSNGLMRFLKIHDAIVDDVDVIVRDRDWIAKLDSV